MLRTPYQTVRRALVFVLGMSTVAVGVIMIVTPGPAILVIPAGLALLATEFIWARRLLERVRERIANRGRSATDPAGGRADPGASTRRGGEDPPGQPLDRDP